MILQPPHLLQNSGQDATQEMIIGLVMVIIKEMIREIKREFPTQIKEGMILQRIDGDDLRILTPLLLFVKFVRLQVIQQGNVGRF